MFGIGAIFFIFNTGCGGLCEGTNSIRTSLEGARGGVVGEIDASRRPDRNLNLMRYYNSVFMAVCIISAIVPAIPS